MSTRIRSLVIATLALAVATPAFAAGQGRGRAQPRPPQPTVVLRGHVFIGGYFYDPIHGPYPWWPRAVYPYRYYPVYDYRAEVRVQVAPKDAAVYVDGFYAGIVDDFDGIFQRLHLTPGGHEIAIYLAGYRTSRHHVYLGPGSSFNLRDALEPLPAGVESEPPPLAPPVPEPPAGTFRLPRRAPPLPAPAIVQPPVTRAAGYGTLNLRVQPLGAEVRIDGHPWVSSDGQHFVVELSAGMHTLEVVLAGYRTYSAQVEIRDDEVATLNVSLARSSLPQGPSDLGTVVSCARTGRSRQPSRGCAP
jgi:hypothetical protein